MSPKKRVELQTILQAAAEIADRNGVRQVTLTSVAKKLHIRPPSLYNHVDGLPGLRRKLAIYGLERLYHELVQAAVGRSEDEAIHALGIAYLGFARKYPGLYEATIVAPDANDEEWNQIGARIVDLILRLLAGYRLEGETALHAVRGLRSLLHGFASLEQNGGFGLALDVNQSLHLIINTFLTGIQKTR